MLRQSALKVLLEEFLHPRYLACLDVYIPVEDTVPYFYIYDIQLRYREGHKLTPQLSD